MKELLFGLTADATMVAATACMFFCFLLLGLAFMRWGKTQMENYEKNFTSEVSANASDMFLFVDPRQLFLFNLGALVIIPSLVWLLLGDVVIALGFAVAILVLPTMWYRGMRAKRLKAFEKQLPDALSMVSGSMRAGASLTIALENLVREQGPPVAQEFSILMQEQRLGVDLDVSLSNMEKRIPLQDFAMLTTALRINREVGGNLAETIESLADTLRRKATMEGKINSLTAQGTMQGYVMAALPILLGILLNLLEPEAMSKLWSTTVGWIVIAVIVVMETLGFLMIRKITSIDV